LAISEGPVSAQGGPRDVVRAGNSAVVAAIKKGDAAAIAALYTTDAEFTQPGDRIRTRASIQGMWQEQLKRGLADADFTTTDADLANGVITEKGTFVFKTKTGVVISKGTYTNTWRREGAAWHIKTNAVEPEKK